MGARTRQPLRPAFRLWHRWFGLGAGLWLLMLAVTGSAITCYDELDTLLNPDWRTVPAGVRHPAAPMAAFDTVVARARAALPGFAPAIIERAPRPGDVHRLIGGADGIAGPIQLFADPRDGRILGWRAMGHGAFDRRHAMDLLYALHTDLLLGPVATSALGFVALLWIVDHGVSLALSLPRRARWAAAWRIAGARGSLRRLFDAHRAFGLWLWPITLTLAVTGLTLAWPEATRDAVRPFSAIGERLHERWPQRPPDIATIGIDRAVARVTRDPARLHSIRLLPRQGVYAVRTFDSRDRDDQGRLWTYVAMTDGAIRGRRHDNGDSAGDQIFAWQYPLHSGKAFGVAGRIAVFIAGIGVAWLCLSGLRLWQRRR